LQGARLGPQYLFEYYKTLLKKEAENTAAGSRVICTSSFSKRIAAKGKTL